jgi:hypothetical protein
VQTYEYNFFADAGDWGEEEGRIDNTVMEEGEMVIINAI